MISAEVARSIRFVGLDVDGVLTDGGIYLGAAVSDGGAVHRTELKRYDIQDGLGIYLLGMAGIRCGIITGRVSESVRMRAAELRIEDLAQDPDAQKLPALLGILDRRGIALAETAFIGDDFPDMAVLRRVVLPVAVGNAVPEVKAACALQLRKNGGAGAIREFAELLLTARGEWASVTERYVAERSLPLAGTNA